MIGCKFSESKNFDCSLIIVKDAKNIAPMNIKKIYLLVSPRLIKLHLTGIFI